MPAVPEVVADLAFYEGFAYGRRAFFHQERLLAQETVHFTRVVGGEVFAPGVGPGVFHAAVHVDGTGCDAGQEHMLVHGKIVFLVDELPRVAAEPVGEAGDHLLECFT